MKFYQCKHCKQIAVKELDKGVKLFCCGEAMEELVPNTHDGATEKHVPVVQLNGNKVIVTIGEVIHPMTEAHLIEFVVLETNKGMYVHHFNHTDQPITEFIISDDEEVIKVYEYCNLHGLWAK